MRISIEEAANRLNAGEVVAIPTETVYGLAARYDLPEAMQKVFALKNRPSQNPLIIHLATADLQLFTHSLPQDFTALTQTFWPGPLTLVIPIQTDSVPEIARAGLPTQAFRLPAHPMTLKLLKLTGPLVAPSANISGRPSAVTPEHVENDFGIDFPVLDGGRTEKGIESTILIFDSIWRLGRLGALPAEAFETILGYIPQSSTSSKPLCPGQYYRHYSPKARIHLGDYTQAQVIIGFTDRLYPKHARLITWGSSQNPEEVLMQLYVTLRQLDLERIEEVWVDVDVPQKGLWSTFLERIKKASAS